MAGNLPHFTEIHYTDDIGSNSNPWVVNQKLTGNMWAQTNSKLFNTRCMPVVKKSSGNTLKGIEVFSLNSKWNTFQNNWNVLNPTWEFISNIENSAYNKNEIMFLYEASPKFYNLKYNTSNKPFTAGISVVDEFNMQKFLPVIMVHYYKMVDNNDDFITTTSTPQSTRVDLKTYLDQKTASGLSDEEYYKRYPIYYIDLVGYYGEAGSRENIKDRVGSNNFVGFGVERENDKTIELLYRNFTGGLNATNNNSYQIQNRILPQVIDRTTGTDGYSSLSIFLNGSQMYIGNSNKACYPFFFTEFEIEEDESLFDEDNKPIVTTYKSNENWILPTTVYPTLSSGKEGIRISPYFTYEYIMTWVALFGIYWTNDSTLVQEDLTDPYNISQGVFLGHMDANGWTDGSYAEGTAIRTFDSSNKNIEDIGDTPYNPNSNPQGSHTETSNSGIWQQGGFSHYYLLDTTDLSQLQTELGDSWRAAIANASQYLISLNQIPYMFYDLINTAARGFMEIGDYTTHNAKGRRVIDSVAEMDYTDIPIPGGKSFLDYHPYTTYSLYIPYCGVVDLPTDSIVGTIINVKYVFDFKSGALVGEVFSQYGELLVTAKGNMYSGDNLEVNSSLLKGIQTVLSISGAVMGGLGGTIASVGSAALAATGKSAKNADMKNLSVATTLSSGTLDVVHTTINALGKDYINIITGDGNYTSFKLPQKCILFTKQISLADSSTVDIYAKTAGFRCEIGGKIGSFKGYNVFNNYHLNVPCTSDEKELLDSWLRSGVIL